MSSLSIVIPVYNEEKVLEKNVKAYVRYLEKLKLDGILDDYEIILYENGSSDNTFEAAQMIASETNNIRAFNSAHRGLGYATRLGMCAAGMQYATVCAIDMGCDIGFIRKALRNIMLHPSYQVIIGSRNLPESKSSRPWFRTLLSKGYTALINLLYGTDFSDVGAARLYETSLAKRIFETTKADDAFIEVEVSMIIKNSSIRTMEIPISHNEMDVARHPAYFIGMIFSDAWRVFSNYSSLRRKSV